MTPQQLDPNANALTGTGGQTLLPRRMCYIEASSLLEVMFDQIEYLVDHQTGECAPDCPECERLARVREHLLAPFCESRRPEMVTSRI